MELSALVRSFRRSHTVDAIRAGDPIAASRRSLTPRVWVRQGFEAEAGVTFCVRRRGISAGSYSGPVVRGARRSALFGKRATALRRHSGWQGVDGPSCGLAISPRSYRRPLPQSREGRRAPVDEGCRRAALARIPDAIFLTRDLINTTRKPSRTTSPMRLGLADVSRKDSIIAEKRSRAFPMIHAVGAGSDRRHD